MLPAGGSGVWHTAWRWRPRAAVGKGLVVVQAHAEAICCWQVAPGLACCQALDSVVALRRRGGGGASVNMHGGKVGGAGGARVVLCAARSHAG